MMKNLYLPIAASLLAMLSTTAFAQNSTLNSKWHSEYDSLGAGKVSAKISLNKNAQNQFGSGKYETRFGNGTFAQVRKEVSPRTGTPPIPPGGPLPGPSSPNSGATKNDAVYIKGLWTFQGTTGWFSWELYETPSGTCKFLGKYGLIQNNQAGPVKGKWTGTLDTGNQGGQGGGSNRIGPLINIPF